MSQLWSGSVVIGLSPNNIPALYNGIIMNVLQRMSDSLDYVIFITCLIAGIGELFSGSPLYASAAWLAASLLGYAFIEIQRLKDRIKYLELDKQDQ